MTSTDILLIEDAPDLAAVIARELEAVGYRVSHAADGETGLRLAREAEYSLILLDWMLPGMDGLDVLRKLREKSPIPVLMLTARDAEIDRVLGLEVGADDYLTKPFSMRELIARVRAMLRRRALIEDTLNADRQTEPSAVIVGDLRLEADAQAAVVAGEAVDLTPTEYALLHLLATNPGRVFSRAYLVDTIWSENYVEGDRSVDNTILRLRKKLRSMGGYIETVWRVGYRWKRG